MTQLKLSGFFLHNIQHVFDLGRESKFPECIAETSVRPDAVLFSETAQQVVMLHGEADERKRAKYQEWMHLCHRQGVEN